MAKEATLQVRMDAQLKADAEALYASMGTSLTEAVRIFARQSVQEQGMPFVIHLPNVETKQRIGIAKGKFQVPADIDVDNSEIAAMFGAKS